MTMLVLRRVLLAIPMLFGIATATFLITHIIPGDPVAHMAGQFATDEAIANMRAEYGLDKSVLEQYWNFLVGLTQGDLGTSVISGQPVASDLAQRLPSTIVLVLVTVLVATIVGVAAGAVAALRRGKRTDSAVRVMSFVLLAVPEFWLALMALYLIFYQMGIAPAPVGQIGLTDTPPTDRSGSALLDSVIALDFGALTSALHHAMLPILVYGLCMAAPIARLMRSAMISILDDDYLRFARSLGLPRSVQWRYATRAALPPVLTYATILFTALIGGAVIVEKIFSWGGAAQYVADAILLNDYNAVQGFVLVTGIISVLVFFLVDLAYMVIDPRVRLVAPKSSRAGRGRSLIGWIRGPRSSMRPQAVPEVYRPVPQPLFTRVRHWLRAVRPERPRKPAWNRSLTVSLSVIVVFMMGSFLIPFLWPDSPTVGDSSSALQAPSWRHPFGTDSSGFDVFVRVFTAPRIDVTLSASGVLLGAIVGIGLGVVAGFSRGWFGEVLMRITDVLQAFPMLLLALVLVALSGSSMQNVVLALAFVNAPIFLRLVRSRVLTVRELRFIEASIALGNSRARLILRHVLPNSIGPAVVQFGLSLGYGILAVAALSFLGVGVTPPTPEWGAMIVNGSANIMTGQWWTVVFPGLALGIMVAAFNLLSEGIERARTVHQPSTGKSESIKEGAVV